MKYLKSTEFGLNKDICASLKLSQYYLIRVDFIETGPNTIIPVCELYFIVFNREVIEILFSIGL